jgi:hypothetical protein
MNHMTDHEKRAQRVQLRMELDDAESDLAHLKESAIRNADSLEAIARRIRRNAALEPSRDDFDVEAELKQRLSIEEFGFLKSSGDSIAALITELRQTRQKVFHLRERDAALTRVARTR